MKRTAERGKERIVGQASAGVGLNKNSLPPTVSFDAKTSVRRDRGLDEVLFLLLCVRLVPLRIDDGCVRVRCVLRPLRLVRQVSPCSHNSMGHDRHTDGEKNCSEEIRTVALGDHVTCVR